VNRRARGLAALAAIAAAFFVSLFLLNRFVDRMIFYPTRGVDLTAEELGVRAEEVFLRTSDGVRIHAFYLPSSGATRALLFLHGNAGNASHRLPNAAELAKLGANVLLLDYRGYGRSDGSPNERGVYADARAGFAHLVESRGFEAQRVVVFGRSIGGAVAVDLAQDRPLAGLVLESTFSSIGDVSRSARWCAGDSTRRRRSSGCAVPCSSSTATATTSSRSSWAAGSSRSHRSRRPSKCSPGRDTTTPCTSEGVRTSRRLVASSIAWLRRDRLQTSNGRGPRRNALRPPQTTQRTRGAMVPRVF
jgi:pimeloyl-ACP methyl ester carboxylesterase